MAKASLNNGQTLYAVNDIFVGPKSHGSARYTINHDGHSERHSSSGVIVSTGLGSTGWFSSLVAGARGVSAALASKFTAANSQGKPVEWDSEAATAAKGKKLRFAWDSKFLYFTVREPFPSKTTGVDMVFGRVTESAPLVIESHMPERGVIFSDGIETDFIEFNSGSKAAIGVAERHGVLVV